MFLSKTFIPSFCAISIIIFRVIPGKQLSPVGVCTSPLITIKILVSFVSDIKPLLSSMMALSTPLTLASIIAKILFKRLL